MTTLPPSGAVRKILIWHQGGLGDLLLAGPALAALSRFYPGALFTGVGHLERWALLDLTLPLEAVWDGNEAAWAWLFLTDVPLPQQLSARLAPFQLAVMFSPSPRSEVITRLHQAGIPRVVWLPSFPLEDAPPDPVAAVQARALAALGLDPEFQPFRLKLGNEAASKPPPELPHPGPWLAVAPGSGNPRKNWPLSFYYEVTRELAWRHELQVAWLAGPAEAPLLPYLKPLAQAQGQTVLAGLPLKRVAAVLRHTRLYLGGDSGLTHLAAVSGTQAVLALFGPTDPRIWAPPGHQVTVIAPETRCAPCAVGREINCETPHCLLDLTPALVATAVDEIFGAAAAANLEDYARKG